MGGARCSYRNCTIRSNGVTHMFHYPVFDKLRCHQWLTNAQRHEFLNLKVSQLKNRVVCQHHFTPDSFMNYKMDKLKFDAIPTVNGPFCEGEWSNQEGPATLPIGLDDIDIDQISSKDKRANFSVKYGDFLINSEMDLPLSKIGIDHCILVNNSELSCNFDKQKSQSQTLPEPKKSLNIVSIAEETPLGDTKINFNEITPEINKTKKDRTHIAKEEIPLGDTNIYYKQINPELNKTRKDQIHIAKEEIPLGDTNIYFKEINPEINKTIRNQIHIAKEETPLEDKNNYFNQITPEINKPRKNKIHIISEKKVSTPVSVTGQLKPVTPNQIITAREKEANRNIQVQIMYHDPHVDIPIPNLDTTFNDSQIIVNPQSGLLEQPTTSLPSLPLLDENYNANNTIALNQEEHLKNINPLSVDDSLQTMSKEAIEPFSIPTESTPFKPIITQITSEASNYSLPRSLLKNKIPPERAAAIQEKRQFNKKLRDMIEFCLDEAPEKQNNQNNKVKRENKADVLKTTREFGKPLKVNRETSQQDGENKVVSLKSPRKEQSSQRVSSFLSKEPTLPSSSEYNMTFLESRLKKMEENLLLRITQNSKNILDLKRTLQPPVEKRSIMTQTKEDEESCKKQLYHEISQFLSPEANSLIYEELFLAKYLKKPSKKASGLSRKRKLRQS